MIIAIDGPAGVGKSTIAQMLAEGLGLIYLNSGNLYRAITYGCLEAKIDPNNQENIAEYAEKARLEIYDKSVILNGQHLESELHSDRIDRYASQVSAIKRVRDVINKVLRIIARDKNVVVEGRDITTIVFPDAEYKFYLDASTEARARRRHEQGTSNMNFREILEAIKKRDAFDINKLNGSLKISPDAIYLDTSDLTTKQVYEKVCEIITIKE